MRNAPFERSENDYDEIENRRLAERCKEVKEGRVELRPRPPGDPEALAEKLVNQFLGEENDNH